MAGEIVLAFGILTFVLAYLAINTPERHGPLQILNYILCFISMLFTGYLAYASKASDEEITGLLIEWNNAFAWVLYVIVAYFMIYLLYRGFELYKQG